MAGQMPYRDFPFIQGPLHPYLIGIFLAPFAFDERAARLFAISITLLSLLVTFAAASRMGGRLAGLLAFAFLVTNLDYVTDLSSGVHPSGPTGALLVALAALLLAHGHPLWAIVSLAVAAGTRVLFAPLAVCVVLAAALLLKEARRPLLLGAGLSAAIFAPFVVFDPRVAWFYLVGQQSQRATLMPRLSSMPPDTLANKLRSLQAAAVSELAAYWPAFLVLLIVLGLLVWPSARARLGRQRSIILTFCAVGTITMFVVDICCHTHSRRATRFRSYRSLH
jgi:hypothetical protein